MIRTLIMAVGFVGSTLVLVWGLGGLKDAGPPGAPAEQVSRAGPDPFGLQPAMSPVVMPQSSSANASSPVPEAPPVQAPRTADPQVPAVLSGARTPAPVRPVARPAALVVPAPRPSAVSAVQPPAITAPQDATIDPEDKVNNALLVMGMGVVNELKKPVDTSATAAATASEPPVARQGAENANAALAAQAALAGAVARRPAAPEAPEPPAERVYTVQPGDSLPGIAFRVYGSTVGYLQILAANQDVLRDPSQLRAGMVLRIPDN